MSLNPEATSQAINKLGKHAALAQGQQKQTDVKQSLFSKLLQTLQQQSGQPTAQSTTAKNRTQLSSLELTTANSKHESDAKVIGKIGSKTEQFIIQQAKSAIQQETATVQKPSPLVAATLADEVSGTTLIPNASQATSLPQLEQMILVSDEDETSLPAGVIAPLTTNPQVFKKEAAELGIVNNPAIQVITHSEKVSLLASPNAPLSEPTTVVPKDALLNLQKGVTSTQSTSESLDTLPQKKGEAKLNQVFSPQNITSKNNSSQPLTQVTTKQNINVDLDTLPQEKVKNQLNQTSVSKSFTSQIDNAQPLTQVTTKQNINVDLDTLPQEKVKTPVNQAAGVKTQTVEVNSSQTLTTQQVAQPDKDVTQSTTRSNILAQIPKQLEGSTVATPTTDSNTFKGVTPTRQNQQPATDQVMQGVSQKSVLVKTKTRDNRHEVPLTTTTVTNSEKAYSTKIQQASPLLETSKHSVVERETNGEPQRLQPQYKTDNISSKNTFQPELQEEQRHAATSAPVTSAQARVATPNQQQLNPALVGETSTNPSRMVESVASAGSQPDFSSNQQDVDMMVLDNLKIEQKGAKGADFQAQLAYKSQRSFSPSDTMLEIVRHAKNGSTSIELQLEPAHLGKVHISLQLDAAKQLQVMFTVDQQTSRQALEQQMPQLRLALAQQGLDLGSFSMQMNQQQHGEQQSGSSAQHAADNNLTQEQSTQEEVTRTGINLATDGHLSILA